MLHSLLNLFRRVWDSSFGFRKKRKTHTDSGTILQRDLVLTNLIGKQGEWKSTTQFVGLIFIDNRYREARSKYRPIQEGQIVRVVGIQSGRLIIELERVFFPPTEEPES